MDLLLLPDGDDAALPRGEGHLNDGPFTGGSGLERGYFSSGGIPSLDRAGLVECRLEAALLFTLVEDEVKRAVRKVPGRVADKGCRVGLWLFSARTASWCFGLRREDEFHLR